MKTLTEELKIIMDGIGVETRDNSDMAMMGDTRGSTLYALTGVREAINKIIQLFSKENNFSKLEERLKAAEDFINFEGSYYATWSRKFEVFNKWYQLTKENYKP